MGWRDLWARVKRPRPPAAMGEFRQIEPFPGRADCFTATRVFPAEPGTVYSFLIRVAANRDPAAVVRLTWHARMVHTLSSPYIPVLADLGIHESLWYVAFRIDPLLRVLPASHVDPHALLRQVAEAVAHLHERGLAHRGLSLSAIAVNSAGSAVLFDLWWVGQLAADRTVGSVLSSRPRTPYDAPEAGEARFDGVRADIYSLGVLAAHILMPGVHSDLLQTMTRHEPSERPPSMSAVLGALSAR